MKKRFIFSILTLVLCLFIGTATAQTYPATQTQTEMVTSTSTTTWTPPAGTWKITKVECWGAGGGGGNTTLKRGAGGGGGGAYAAYSSVISTTPGASFNIQVGAGGTGGNAGGNSYFSAYNEANAYAAAGGGKSPNANTENPGAAGGTVNKGTGYAGGAGGSGNHGATFASGSGGGGGAAGPNSAGVAGGNGTNIAGGNGGTGKAGIGDGGDGGAGVSYGNDGRAGKTYGGGGSGAAGSSFDTHTGGSGAQGAIRITYETLELQVTRNLNYDGAPSGGIFTIDFYGKYTAANLPTPTRDGYIFLGWTTDPAGQNYLTTDSVCKKTNNYTIYAHWGDPGTITTSDRELSSVCGKDTVKSLADPSGASYFRYTWHYTFNDGELQTISNSDVKEYAVSSSILTQAGTYVFTRSVAFRNGGSWSSDVTSEGAYTIVYNVETNAITAKDTTARALNDGFSIQGSEVTNATYRWKKDGEVLDEATGRNLTVEATSLICPNKQSQYQREVMAAPCGWQTSDNVYKISIALDTIENKTVSYTHNHPQITIQGEVVPNSEYYWNCQNFPVSGASDQSLTIPANSLCPDSAYEFTRNVESVQCPYDAGSSRSAGKYTVIISTDAGSIVGGDSTVVHNYGTITIEGTAINNVEYKWFCNNTVISGAESENYTIPAGLCPDSTYVFTRKVKAITHVDAKWQVSANTYTLRVQLDPGSIDSKEDTTITTMESLTINGEDMGANVTYEWLQNGESTSVTTQSYTLDAANVCLGSYTYTRKVISSSCEKYKMSENEYKVTVTFPTGAIDSSAIDICGINVPDDKSVASIEPAVAQYFKYIWMYSKNGAAFVNTGFTSEGLSNEQLSAICSDVQDDATYIIRRYAKLTNGCEMDSVASKGSVKICFKDMENDTLDAPAINVTCNYGENFIYREILPVPALMHKGAARTDWIDTVLSPAAKIYPDPATMKVTVHWKIKDKCGFIHEKDQEVTLLLPPCGEDHTVTDIDGNVYGTVRIGFNCWMKENLKVTHYADGTDIPDLRAYVGENEYADSARNAQIFGLLYTWDAAVNNTITADPDEKVQGACPDGWCVPDAAQFEKMLGIDIKTLRSADYWLTLDGTNTTEFTMLPAGRYNDAHNRCENLLGNAFFWTSSAYSEAEVRTFEADCHCYKWQEVLNPKTAGLSVRCIEVERQPISMSVTTDSANTVTSSSTKLYGNVTDMGGKTEVKAGFKYGTSESALTSVVAKEAAMTATGLFSYDITGLTANTTYYFKAFAANGTDTVYGEVKDFTTTAADGQPCPGTPTVTDVDNNTYNTVQIGNQCWMKENLRTKTKSAGKGNIFTPTTETVPGYDVNIYGRFYDLPAVMQGESFSEAAPSGVQGICPTGWHVPSKVEWDQLINYVNRVEDYKCGGMDKAIANALSAATGWTSTSGCGAGHSTETLNKTGFSAVPAGYIEPDYGYYQFNTYTYFWSATNVSNNAYDYYLSNLSASVFIENSADYFGLSVRCLKDN